MIEREQGKIVNIAGTSSLRGYQNRVSYSASKWAVRGITRTIALEAGSTASTATACRPVRSSAIAWTRSSGARPRSKGKTYEQVFDDYLSEQAIKRFTSAVDIAYACLYLASEECAPDHGQCLTVDGGWDV